MKNTSFVFACCLIIVCGIFKFYSNLTFAEAVPAPIVTATPLPPTVSTGEATFDYSGHYTWNNGIIPCDSGGIYTLTASAEDYHSVTQLIYVEPCIEGTRDFELQPITTPTPIVTPTPWLITEDATNITSSSATLNATVPLVVGRIYFEYSTASGSYTNSVDAVREDMSDKVSADISGLSPATTYFDRVVVFEKPPGGYTYGNEKSFTTLAATPQTTPTPCDEGIILETYKATDVTSDSATLNGFIGGEFSVRGILGFELGTSSGSYTNNIGIEGSDSGPIFVEAGYKSVRVNGLSAGTTYYYRIYKYRIEIIPDFTPCYSYGNEEIFTTLTGAVCEAESIEASPKKLELRREESGNVTVTVEGSEGCPVAGETVTAKIKSGKKRISISPQSTDTNVNGQAIFTIIATKKTGNAKVKFETAGGLKATVTAKVRR